MKRYLFFDNLCLVVTLSVAKRYGLIEARDAAAVTENTGVLSVAKRYGLIEATRLSAYGQCLGAVIRSKTLRPH